MTQLRLMRLAIFMLIHNEYLNDLEFASFIDKNYSKEAIDNDYIPLIMDFLNDYALTTTEKSD